MTNAGFACRHCGRDTFHDEYYMIHDHLFAKALPRRRGMLCIGCVEAALGRELCAADFTDCPLNQMCRDGVWYASPRLLDRLNRA